LASLPLRQSLHQNAFLLLIVEKFVTTIETSQRAPRSQLEAYSVDRGVKRRPPSLDDPGYVGCLVISNQHCTNVVSMTARPGHLY
jgi:hypothetical protein